MFHFKNLSDANVKDKIVLLRTDFNVPIIDNVIQDDTRMRRSLPTIQYLMDQNAKVVILSHLGRIKEADDLAEKSLEKVSFRLAELLEHPVEFCPAIEGKELEEAIQRLEAGQVLVVENTRFADIINAQGDIDLKAQRESTNNPALGKYWASLGDIFVNDAFAVVHRAHASNVGIPENMQAKYAGNLILDEVNHLEPLLDEIKHPYYVLLGGAKVIDKIKILESVLEKADKVLIGGGMSYTFQKILGNEIGTSLYDEKSEEYAKSYLEKYKDKIILPLDYAVSKTFENTNNPVVYTEDVNIPKAEMGLDIGPKTVELFSKELQKAKTLFWNGPVGVFEFTAYGKGTRNVCEAIIQNKECYSVIGGGDSASAAVQGGFQDGFSHISTGGGASLAFIEGDLLPGLNVLIN